MVNNNEIKLGLALSGGGARGLAHIGVLKALENAGVRPDYLAGTSMGGVIAAAYASGLSPADLEQIALEYSSVRRIWKLADPSLPRQGLFQGERLREFFEEHLQGCTFADLRIPLTLIAVDLNKGQEIHMQEGLVSEAVRATVSIPGLLAPVEREGQKLVDGGLLNNLPVDAAQSMGADITLGVDVYTTGEGSAVWHKLGQTRVISQTIGELIVVLGDSLDLLIHQQSVNNLQKNPPDFLISPDIPMDVTALTGYHRAADLIPIGEKAVTAILSDLQASLKLTKQV